LCKPLVIVQHTQVLPPRHQVEQGQAQHGQVTFWILNLAVDFLESLDVGLHELGIEDTTLPTVYDAQRETEPW